VTQYEDGRFEELERHLTIPEHFDGATKLLQCYHDRDYLHIRTVGHEINVLLQV
jgi:6-phosphogluconolactonase